MIKKIIILLLLLPTAIYANDLSLTGIFNQGGIVIGNHPNAKKVTFENRELKLSDEGYFLFGFSRKFKNNSSVKVELKSGELIEKSFKINERTYEIEVLKGLPSKMVTPNAEQLEKIREDRATLSYAIRSNSEVSIFPKNFIRPLDGRTSGLYGSERILNGQKRNPHGGWDIAAPVGTPIKATAGGKILLAQKGFYYTGNVVIIGHGYDLKSMYIHMDKINVKKGDIIKQGDVIGTVGMTGRTLGPHLHWNVYWQNIKIDPELLMKVNVEN